MRVKELLKERGMTAKELAARLGMTETGLSIAIGDNGNPPLKRLQEIADILGVEVPELFAASKEGAITCPHCGKSITIKGRITSTIPTHGTTNLSQSKIYEIRGPAGDAGP